MFNRFDQILMNINWRVIKAAYLDYYYFVICKHNQVLLISQRKKSQHAKGMHVKCMKTSKS